jgi:hypothetical protein
LGFTIDQIKEVLEALIFGEGVLVNNKINNTVNNTVNNTNSHINAQNIITENISVNDISFSLDEALDWLCFHLQSNDLPKLFTDINHRQDDKDKSTTGASTRIDNNNNNNDDDGDNNNDNNRGGNFSVIKHHYMEEIKGDDGTSTTDNVKNNDNNCIQIDKVQKKNEQNSISHHRHGDVNDAEASKATAKAKGDANKAREWLLSQYEFEDDDIHTQDDNDHKNPKKSEVQNRSNSNSNSNSNSHNNNTNDDHQSNNEEEEKEEERPKFPEEIRLERLEKEIKELREDVNDEASNYMRSKYEIADMKKKLKKIEGQAKGLRGKVAKKIAEFEAAKAAEKMSISNTGDDDNDNDDMEDEEEGCGMGLFDAPAPVNTSTTATEEPAINIVKVINYIDADIPRDWSGKTPKVMLLEHCRKQKWAKPSFTKMENTTNGCIVKVKQSQQNVIICSEEGPFHSFSDAEHYLSTKALYTLNPTLPMYLLMPPVFRDVWTSWLKEKETKRNDALIAEENEQRDKISALITHLSNVVNSSNNNKLNKSNLNRLGADDIIDEEAKDTLDNWDDESFSSEKSDNIQIPENNQPNQSIANKTSIPQTYTPTKMGEKLRNAFINRQKRQSYDNMYQKRQTLPIFNYRQQILDTVKNNSVTVLCAETGET